MGRSMAEATKFLDEDAVALLLSVSVRTIQRWRKTGEGPAFVRAGARRVIYNPTAVETWAAARTFAHRADEMSRRAPR
jgi:predicted DNA-binding transcriptional regulator AlpA